MTIAAAAAELTFAIPCGTNARQGCWPLTENQSLAFQNNVKACVLDTRATRVELFHGTKQATPSAWPDLLCKVRSLGPAQDCTPVAAGFQNNGNKFQGPLCAATTPGATQSCASMIAALCMSRPYGFQLRSWLSWVLSSGNQTQSHNVARRRNANVNVGPAWLFL